MSEKLIAVLGPTASGKTALAVRLCRALGGEAISCDSMQIYRGMDIGTAKPTSEERGGVPHHMLDVCDPREEYSVARYVREADAAVRDVLSRGKVPVLVGGTGLYADALIRGTEFSARQEEKTLRSELAARLAAEGGEALLAELAAVDPETAARLHANDGRRIVRALEVYRLTGKPLSVHDAETRAAPPRYDALRLVLCPQPRELLYRRIADRVEEMFARGLEAEVRGLLSAGVPAETTAMQAIGYKETAAAIRGEISMEAAKALIVQNTRHYAKRQITWFRRAEHEDVVWHTGAEFAAAEARCAELAAQRLGRV